MARVAKGARFRTFAQSAGFSVFNTDKLPRNEHGQHWLALFLDGLQQIVAGYHGDRNQNGDTYKSESGLFDELSFNGTAYAVNGVYTFGLTVGMPLRLRAANLLLAKGRLDAGETAGLERILANPSQDFVNAEIEPLLGELEARPVERLQALRLTYFGFSYAWMHEAFHTLIGHVDSLGPNARLMLTEMNVPAPGTEDEYLHHCIELDADYAAISNFVISVAGNASFGLKVEPTPSPSQRAADVALSCILAFLAMELQRLTARIEETTTHPLPRLRVVSALRSLSASESRGEIPRGTTEELKLKIRPIQEALANTPVACVLDIVAGDRQMAREDVDRISWLIRSFKASRPELERFKYVQSI